MDSGNSGSLQSSSGGDEEYDSRAAASAFMSGAPISNPPQQQQQPFFDPLSSYLQLLHHNNNPNPNSAWPRIRSDTNPIPHDLINSSAAFVPTFHPPPPPSAPAAATQNPTAPGRNTKKRSRASRRAPTTVLTTDTTNFRAMVQEFTGIPAPPFDSSPFQRTRLDLFGASRSAANSFDAPPPPYLRRPFAQKVQQPIPSSSGSTSNPAAAVNNNYHSSPMNLFQNPFLTNFISPKFTFSDPNPGPLQIPPSNDHPQFGNHFSPQHNGVDGSGGFGNLPHGEGGKQPDNNVGGGEGMVESWICSSE